MAPSIKSLALVGALAATKAVATPFPQGQSFAQQDAQAAQVEGFIQAFQPNAGSAPESKQQAASSAVAALLATDSAGVAQASGALDMFSSAAGNDFSSVYSQLVTIGDLTSNPTSVLAQAEAVVSGKPYESPAMYYVSQELGVYYGQARDAEDVITSIFGTPAPASYSYLNGDSAPPSATGGGITQNGQYAPGAGPAGAGPTPTSASQGGITQNGQYGVGAGPAGAGPTASSASSGGVTQNGQYGVGAGPSAGSSSQGGVTQNGQYGVGAGPSAGQPSGAVTQNGQYGVGACPNRNGTNGTIATVSGKTTLVSSSANAHGPSSTTTRNAAGAVATAGAAAGPDPAANGHLMLAAAGAVAGAVGMAML